MDCDLLHNPLDQEIPFADIDPDDPLPLTVIAEGMPIVSEKLDVAETRFLKETGFLLGFLDRQNFAVELFYGSGFHIDGGIGGGIF